MSTIRITIDVNVSAEIAYDQWRRLEKLPQFLEVEGQVEQLQGNALQQNTQIINPDIDANLEITCRTPSSRTVWSYQSGTIEGIVSFHEISDVMSKVLVHLPDTSEGDPKYVELDVERCRSVCKTIWSDLRYLWNDKGKRQKRQSEPFSYGGSVVCA